MAAHVGIEGSAFGVGNARVGGEGGFFGAPGGLNLEGGLELLDVRRIKLEVAREGAQFFGLGQAGVRVLGGDVGQLDGGFHQVVDAFARQIGSVRRAGPLANQNTQAGAARAGFLEILELAHAHVGGELVALGNGAFGVAGAGRQRAFHDIAGQLGKMVLAHAVPPTVIRSILMVGMPTPPARSGLLCRTCPCLRRAAGRCPPC